MLNLPDLIKILLFSIAIIAAAWHVVQTSHQSSYIYKQFEEMSNTMDTLVESCKNLHTSLGQIPPCE